MTIDPDKEKRFQEELKEKKEAEEKAKLGIVLSCKMNPDGSLEWQIPSDLRQAIHLHKHLEIVINKMYEQLLDKMMAKPKDDIRNKLTLLR